MVSFQGIVDNEIKKELAAIEKDYAYACWRGWEVEANFGVSFEDYWAGLKKVHN